MCIDQSRLGYNRLYKNSLSLASPCSWVCTQRGRYVLLSRQPMRCYFPCHYQCTTVLQRPAQLDSNSLWHCLCSWTDSRLFLWSSSPCDVSYQQWRTYCSQHQQSLINFVVLLTVHLSIFISVINQLDAQNFCFTISLFHASTCFEHMCSSSGGQNCIKQPLVSSHL